MTQSFKYLPTGGEQWPRQVPFWAISLMFFFTSYNAISKRYLTTAWCMGRIEDPVLQAAVVGFMVNLAMVLGTVVFSRASDRFQCPYWFMQGMLGMTLVLVSIAWLLSLSWSLKEWRVQCLMLLSVFVSSGPPPLRDAITSKLALNCQSLDPDKSHTAQTFGKHRLFTAAGQIFLALITSNAMHFFGPISFLLVFAGCVALALLVFTIMLKGVADWYAQGNTNEAEIQVKSNFFDSSQLNTLDLVLLRLSFALIGIASGLIECILFVHLHELGMSLSVLGVAHAISVATEIPVFYFEAQLVNLFRSYEVMFFVSCAAMWFRLCLLAAFVVQRPPTMFIAGLVIFEESFHGLARAPVSLVTARLAALVAPPHLRTIFQGQFALAAGQGGSAICCFFIWLCSGFGARVYFAAGAVISAVAAIPILAYELRRQALEKCGRPVKIKRLVILVRADPVVCGHSTEARNLAEAARKRGTEVHIVTWPLEVLKQAKLPLKTHEEEYSAGIQVHRPEALGDEKVLDGRLLQGMAGRIVEVLRDGGSCSEESVDEVDVLMTMYLVPHCQIASLAAQSLKALGKCGVYKRKLVSVAKAVGSDITSQVTACLRTGRLGGAMVILHQFLENDILQAVSLYTKDLILESARSIDNVEQTSFAMQLDQAIETSYPPLDTNAYRPFAASEETAMAKTREVCKKYGVAYGKFVLYISRIMPAKGVDDLVNAYMSSKVMEAGIPLLVAGAGPDLEKIRQLAALGSHISVIGALLEEDKIPLMNACIAFCLPSKPTPSFVETFGIAVTEKMLAGGPGLVVTTRVGGIPEASGGPGFCVEVEHSSEESIRAGLEQVVFMPESERVEKARKACAYAQRFRREEMWQEIESSVCNFVKEEVCTSGQWKHWMGKIWPSVFTIVLLVITTFVVMVLTGTGGSSPFIVDESSAAILQQFYTPGYHTKNDTIRGLPIHSYWFPKVDNRCYKVADAATVKSAFSTVQVLNVSLPKCVQEVYSSVGKLLDESAMQQARALLNVDALFVMHYPKLAERKVNLTKMMSEQGLAGAAIWVEWDGLLVQLMRHESALCCIFDCRSSWWRIAKNGTKDLSLRHLYTYYLMHTKDLGRIIVLEDDTYFDPRTKIATIVKDLLRQVPEDFTALMLGGSRDWHACNSSQSYRADGYAAIGPGYGARTGDGYLLSRVGANLLLDKIFNSGRGLDSPADVIMDGAINLGCYWAEPPLWNQTLGGGAGNYATSSRV